jgi:hypothetical protein
MWRERSEECRSLLSIREPPNAALFDPRFYGVLALSDAIRSGRTRESNLAIELLKKEIHA